MWLICINRPEEFESTWQCVTFKHTVTLCTSYGTDERKQNFLVLQHINCNYISNVYLNVLKCRVLESNGMKWSINQFAPRVKPWEIRFLTLDPMDRPLKNDPSLESH